MENDNHKDIELGNNKSSAVEQEVDMNVSDNPFEDIESEEEHKPNRVNVKKVSVKMNEMKDEKIDKKEEEIPSKSPVTNVAIEVIKLNTPVRKPVAEDIIIKKNNDPEESQRLYSNQNEFDNMMLDVPTEFLVKEDEYSGNIDLSNKEMTKRVKFF